MVKLLESKKDELHLVGLDRSLTVLLLTLTSSQLAQALVEHETLNMEEVKKVIKGEPIRNIEEVVGEDISRMSLPKDS